MMLFNSLSPTPAETAFEAKAQPAGRPKDWSSFPPPLRSVSGQGTQAISAISHVSLLHQGKG